MHGTVSPSSVASPSRVRLDASVSRPVTEISPMVMTSTIASSSTTGSEPTLSPAGTTERSVESDVLAGVSPVDAGSAEGTAVIPVQPGTDVAFGVERVVAQRAGRATGRHHLLGVFGEIARLGQRKEHPQRVRAVLPVFQHDLLANLFLGQRQQFDDDLRSLAVPGQAHGADPELGVDRGGEREFGAGQRAGSRIYL